ncbi:methyltransferase domain-containing protein [Amycolatopsis sp. NPDC051071]|uniref:methyltransferase domain-containing protein n=1 Tax=Amycolatopsis sp. NPDC051071 TaxID=3154637 RepID=UPI00341359CE
MNVLQGIQDRYSAASRTAEPGLCCPVDYDPKYLRVIPAEVIERDYGCGDPVSHVRPGETVLDLGSGGGKVCFIAAQIVGRAGSVIGVDVNDDMLALARGAQSVVAKELGFANVTFAKARIEDLALDLEFVDTQLSGSPVASYGDLEKFEARADRLRRDSPLIPDHSVDVVISNCVLNLVSPARKQQMFAEIARVLRPGGRAVISDIVSDVDVPQAMRDDTQLWSGCYSGALREDRFLQAFRDVGMHGLTVQKRDTTWETIGGVAFRSMTVAAYLPASVDEVRRERMVFYRGPFAKVTTDDGTVLQRGVSLTVRADAVAQLITTPYAEHVLIDDFAGSLQEPRETGQSTTECCLPSPDGGPGTAGCSC